MGSAKQHEFHPAQIHIGTDVSPEASSTIDQFQSSGGVNSAAVVYKQYDSVLEWKGFDFCTLSVILEPG